jgi:uridine kinase
MPNDGVLIVDGVFALRPELDSGWDLRIWIDIDPEVALHRSTTRDSKRESTGRAEPSTRSATHQRSASTPPRQTLYPALT